MTNHYRHIEALLYQYAYRLDAGDLGGVADLFAHGKITSRPGEPGVTGREAVLALYQRATRLYPDNNTPHTQHVVSNITIDIADSGLHAQARSYFTVYQALPGFPLQVIIAGRYEDNFECVNDIWRFSARQISPELLGDLSRHLLLKNQRFDPHG